MTWDGHTVLETFLAYSEEVFISSEILPRDFAMIPIIIVDSTVVYPCFYAHGHKKLIVVSRHVNLDQVMSLLTRQFSDDGEEV